MSEMISNVISYSKKLHDYLRDYAKLSEGEKPLLISGILIALSGGDELRDKFLYDSEQCETSIELAELLVRRIEYTLKYGDKFPEQKVTLMLHAYNFIKIHPELTKQDSRVLKDIIDGIKENVLPVVNAHHNYDILGQFYGEFLKYTGGDKKGLGIVLTPKHITELFSKLAKVDENTIVLDPCAGTGGFLISAMKQMMDCANGDEEKENIIKRNNLIGIEQQPNMFALVASNMILRGDGKSNLYQGNCFDENIKNIVKEKHKPTVGLINPPYSQKNTCELEFIENMLDMMEIGGIGIALVPLSSAIDIKNKVRQRLLSKHTLDAVMSMPNDLFPRVGAITCIMIFKANIPHNPQIPSWLSYWKDDGFVIERHIGRTDLYNKWKEVEQKWISSYFNREVIDGYSVLAKVTDKDEWCCESYITMDYSTLKKEDFENKVRKYIQFKISSNIEGRVNDEH